MTRVEIYSSMFCGYCSNAKRLLKDKGVEFTEFDVSLDATKLQEMLSRSGGRRTVPQIFIGGAHIGGYKELAALDRAGKLDSLLEGSS